MFKPLNTSAVDIKKQEGKPFVGTYTGKKDIETKIGKQVIWQFVDEFEQPFGIYGFSMLNRSMEMIHEGTLVRITYQGMKNVKTAKFGMKDVHQVLVEVDTQHKESDQAEVVGDEETGAF